MIRAERAFASSGIEIGGKGAPEVGARRRRGGRSVLRRPASAPLRKERQQKMRRARAGRFVSPFVNAGEAESRCLIDTDRQTGAMSQRKYTTS
jgi:hypothetical protein